MNLRWNDIPGLREEVKRENDVRDAAFLDLTTNICGIEIRQMTPRDMLILDGVDNPILNGGFPTPYQLADFLWKLSPQFKERAWFRRYQFGRKCRNLDFVSAVIACRKYIEDTFQDSPGGSGPAGVPYAGWPAHLVTSLSSNPVEAEQVILNTPLKRLFQYLKCIRRRNDPNCPMHNPSDKVKGDYIRRLALKNERQKLVNILNRRATN